MSRVRRNGVDLWLYTAVLILMTIGVVEVYSSSVFIADPDFSGGHAHYFMRQLMFFGIALFAMLIFAAIDYRLLRKLLWPSAIVVISLLVVVVVFMRDINSASRWIDFGYFRIQPSEIFKYIVVLMLADYFARDAKNRRASRSRYLIPGSIAVGTGLIILEPALGTAIVISAVSLSIMFLAGVNLRKIALGGIACSLVGSMVVFVFKYKLPRIIAFINSIDNPLQGAYQVKQSILYIGSGGFLGKGVGRGAAKLFFIPEVHTDFIFANFAEEGGFIWVMIVFMLFVILFWRGLKIAIAAQDRFGVFLAFGITMVLTTSALINIAVTVNLIPTTGIALPFISYGGSSMLTSASAVGVLLNISRRRRRKIPLFGKHE